MLLLLPGISRNECAKYFTHITLFNPHNLSKRRQVILQPHFTSEESETQEKMDSPKPYSYQLQTQDMKSIISNTALSYLIYSLLIYPFDLVNS